ncbi:DinB family protein [Flavobacterium sp. UMI-01]|uniref:DinB family protein n=1 Tax=Flavobacterium sp. UMI-01 TaxID=1441053 RepID=UPI00207FA3FF|nr:DinB family protein [Flavobacterium sp. UMI-01]GIZ09048.1 hypothetical protein FUMI01_17750 [Flavobacterium sp. UMI-01]
MSQGFSKKLFRDLLKTLKMQTEKLIQQLIEQTEQLLTKAEKLKLYNLDHLSWRENENSWNILECLEHLNLYGDFYLPQIESKIKKTNSLPEQEFRKGLFGNYFAKSMLPKVKPNKMKTFKDKDPVHRKLHKSVIDRFINQQVKLLELLNLSKKVNLNKVKIETSISSLIKLKLGDTFQFYINHMIRHFIQIDRLEHLIKNRN